MKPKLLFSLFAIAIMLMAALPTQAQKNEAYVVVSDDGATLTFYYDAQKSSRTGTVYGIKETRYQGRCPAWAGVPEANNTWTTTVVRYIVQELPPDNHTLLVWRLQSLEEYHGLGKSQHV